jgi:hypothetical protein
VNALIRAAGDYLDVLVYRYTDSASITRVRKDGSGVETLLRGRHLDDIAVDETRRYVARSHTSRRSSMSGDRHRPLLCEALLVLT